MSGEVCDREPLCTTTTQHHTHTDADGRSWCCGPYPYTIPAVRPAAGDTRTDRERLREAIVGALIGQPVVRESYTVPLTPRDAHLLSDAVLALPEVAALLHAAEKVRRVDELADGGLHDDILAGRVSINVIRKIRQAVDGQQ